VEIGQRRLDHHDVRPLCEVELDLAKGLGGVRGVLLVGRPVAFQGGLHRLAERSVEPRCVLGGIGQDDRVGETSLVESRTDVAHLAVHHPAQTHHAHAGRRLRERHRGIPHKREVVVDAPLRVEHPAVPMVSELVQTQVGHHHEVITDGFANATQRHVEDALTVVSARTCRVPGGGHSEDHQTAQTGSHSLMGHSHQRVQTVLEDTGHRPYGLGLAGTLADEYRQHQLSRMQPRLSHQCTQRRGLAQATWSLGQGIHCLAFRRVDALRALGRTTHSPTSAAATARPMPYSAKASTSEAADASGASTSTRRPCSSAILAVAGPIQATTVEGCGLPAIPTRFRTVEDEVKTTASNLPLLIASRIHAAGGAARTVRYAVTSSTSQPISCRPATRVSVAMSARGRKTRLMGSRTSSKGGQSSSRPRADCSPDGTRSGSRPHSRRAPAVTPPTAAIRNPANARASRPNSSNFSRTARTAFTEVNPIHSYRPVTKPLMARSICCGVRGGSTRIVGTTSLVAPYDARRAVIEPAWSLVRGTRMFQPNSGLVSNHESCSRSRTVEPTTASDGNST